MFTTESEKRDFAIKPMNCPGHVQIFNSGLRSYRELPLRYGEFGACHRNEPSGALHGIMRVRGFTQDDGHIFCTEEQIQPEVTAFNRLALAVYKDFGFTDIAIKIALRPDKRLGSDETWDRAENALREALRACDVEWTELPGEGAFYGPKVEYHLKDSIGRVLAMRDRCRPISRCPGGWAPSTSPRTTPARSPVMLHRAIVGSLERFIGILIENYAGRAAALACAGPGGRADDHRPPGGLCPGGRRRVSGAPACGCSADLRNEKITYKIREHSLQKLPYQLIVGDKEMQAGQVAVRTRSGEDLGAMPVDALLARLREEVAARR